MQHNILQTHLTPPIIHPFHVTYPNTPLTHVRQIFHPTIDLQSRNLHTDIHFILHHNTHNVLRSLHPAHNINHSDLLFVHNNNSNRNDPISTHPKYTPTNNVLPIYNSHLHARSINVHRTFALLDHHLDPPNAHLSMSTPSKILNFRPQTTYNRIHRRTWRMG